MGPGLPVWLFWCKFLDFGFFRLHLATKNCIWLLFIKCKNIGLFRRISNLSVRFPVFRAPEVNKYWEFGRNFFPLTRPKQSFLRSIAKGQIKLSYNFLLQSVLKALSAVHTPNFEFGSVNSGLASFYRI